MTPPFIRDHWSIAVVIPAHNEETTIERCLRSVLAASDHCGSHGSLWMVVVADACTDGTADIAQRAIGPFGEVLECQVRSAGAARNLGAAAALAHFQGAAPAQVWIANTDADTHVARNWLRVLVNWANEGVAALAGVVKLEREPAGTHRHIHGANVAIRADAFLDAGGWSHRNLADDDCLWSRLRCRGWRIVSPSNSVVVRATRLHGAARGGFADALRLPVDAVRAHPDTAACRLAD